MSHKLKHDFHLVDPSPWPITISFSLFFLALSGVFFIHNYNYSGVLLSLAFIATLFCAFMWWRDVINEGIVGKHHTYIVRQGLKIGMSLFILSEIMFFFAFFFSYFNMKLFPAGVLDDNNLWIIANGVWPPKNIELINPWEVPLLNTLILLISGTSVTWAHYAILENNQEDAKNALLITMLLGFIFSILQIYEYHHASFHMQDGVYAANFYLATGFHGLHVFIGTIFLLICYIRAKKGHFVRGRGHLGFEFAAWYWHFVDVVWLFLFVFVYVAPYV